MTMLKPVGFALVALGAALLALLAFAASQALATTPSQAFAWPTGGSGGTTSTILVVVSLAIVGAAAATYGFFAMKSASAAQKPALAVLPGGDEDGKPEDLRRAA